MLARGLNVALASLAAVVVTAIAGATAASAAPTSLAVNFQAQGTTTPSGYLGDYGQAYDATRGYGWVSASTGDPVSLVGNGRERGVNADKRLDTFMSMQLKAGSPGVSTPGSWKALLTNGTYQVTVAVGDPSYIDSRHILQVEGQAAVDFTPTASTLFKTATVTVTVTDGVLDLTATGGTNTKIDYLIATSTSAPPDTTPPAQVTGVQAVAGNNQVSLAWTASTASDLASYRVFRSTTATVDTSGTPLKSGLTTTSTTDTTAVNGTKYYYAIVARDTSGNDSTPSTVVSATPAAPSGQQPWTTAVTLPATVEAENYDKGGEGVAYHDLDAANQGGAYRPTEGVDLEPTADTGGGYNIGHISAGEWTEYTVNVPTAGKYDIGIRFASGNYGGKAHVELNGTNVTGTINLPATGDWQTWTTVWASGVTLPAATNAVLRLSLDATNGGDIGNINSIIVRSTVSATKPPWPSSWSTAASAPQPRFESAATLINGKVYAFGGFSNSQFQVNRTYVSYDIATNTWTALGTLPVGMAETHLGVANDGTRYVYFAGGFAGDLTSNSPSQTISDKLWRYDTSTNTFTQLGRLPAPRGAGALDLVGRTLHYFGGNPADRVTNVGDHYVYNLDTGTWSTAAAMPNPKDHFSTVVLGGKIYAMGGEHGHDQLHLQQSDMWVYDPATNAWKQLANMLIAKSHDEGGTFVSDGKIVMAGGQIDNFQPTAQVMSYDPAADAWSTLPNLPVQRQGAIIQRIGSKMVLTLGGTQTDTPQAGTWIGQLP